MSLSRTTIVSEKLSVYLQILKRSRDLEQIRFGGNLLRMRHF